MRRVCARLRRLNRASSSASERVRLWGLWLSVVRLTGSPHRKKIFDQHECAQKPPQNLSVPRRGASRKGVVGSRCGNDAPWKAWKSRAHNQGARFPHSHSDGGGSSSASDLPSPQRAGRESSRHRLLENQRALKEVLHVGSTEDLLFQSFLHRSPQNLRAVALQDLVQPIHFPHPLPGPPMDDLGEIAESRLPQIQQLLPLQITLPPLS